MTENKRNESWENREHDQACYAIIDFLKGIEPSYVKKTSDFKNDLKSFNNQEGLIKIYQHLQDVCSMVRADKRVARVT